MHPVHPDGGPQQRAAVLGSPIGHSKSPLLHGAAYAAIGVDCSYSAVDLGTDSLARFIADVRATPGWRGLSVTMPLKAAMAELTDTNVELATAVGVVNTVVVEDRGAGRFLTGHNTDVVGISDALTSSGVDRPSRSVILGGGGTAAAAIAGLAALHAPSVEVVVRRPEGARDALRIGALSGIDVVIQPWDRAEAALRSADVVISTLPPRAGDPLAGSLGPGTGFRTDGTLLDVAYDPWPSALARSWQTAGGAVVHGLDMLIHQAAEQVRLFFPEVLQNRSAVLDVMCDAVGTPRR